MKTFKAFLSEINLSLNEAVKTGLQTPGNDSENPMNHKALHDLIHSGTVNLNHVTEKTDGSVFHLHYDHKGFGSQYSGSGNEIMRSKADYIERAKRRAAETGKEYDPKIAEGFGKFHEALVKHRRLQEYMKSEYERTGKPVHIQGEAFNKFMGEAHDNGKTHQWAVTKYDTDKMGKFGAFILHSKLPGNETHAANIHKLKGDDLISGINIDDDVINHKASSIDVSDEAAKLKALNHDLLNSRTTKTNKIAKEAEQAKVREIGNAVQTKINTYIIKQNLKPKWSKSGESEGFVVHPPIGSSQPRFKVLSPNFINTKRSATYKNKWAKR